MTAPQVFGAPEPGDLEHRRPAETMLASVLEDLAESSGNDTIVYGVHKRPTWEVRYSTVIDDSEMLMWREAAKDPSMPTGVNRLLKAQITLAAKCLAIIKDGEDVTDGSGKPVTFASEEFQRHLGVKTAEQAVQAFYRRDPDVLAASDELLIDAGWAGGVPTKRS